MMSRYGLWLVCVGALSLAGCANWQGRLGNRTPGSAATMAPPPPSADGSLIAAPGSSMSEPPPPMAPPSSGFGQSLAPLDGGPQKLDISSIDAEPAASGADRKVSSSAVPDKMYNLDGGPSGKSGSSSSRKSSTLSRLASKAEPAERTEVSEKVEAPARSRSPLATVKKLSADASAESASEKPVAKSAPAETQPKAAAPAASEAQPAASNGVAAGSSLPQPAVASPARTAPAADIDTTLLAQPVRKGSGDEKKESKGPQSNAGELPGFFTGKHKPSIYPVSNPAPAERVDLGRFS